MVVRSYNSFDVIRLLAAMQVVFFHSYAHLKLQPFFGGTYLYDILASLPGVPIFFVVSGFLITQSFDRSIGLGSFYKKRLLRVYPALIVNILLIESFVIAFDQHKFIQSTISTFIQYELLYMLTAASNVASYVLPVKFVSPTGSFFAMYPSGVLWTKY